MQEAFLWSLESGSASPELLARLGDPEPARSIEAFRSAINDPDLSAHRAFWVPELLCGARPGHGARCIEELAQRYRRVSGNPLDISLYPTVPRLLASSDFLARLLLRHPHWVAELRGALPEPPDTAQVEAEWTAIRIAKYKGLLRIAARDLNGRDFEQSLTELSQLADRLLLAGMTCAEADTGQPAPMLFALGKLGGSELNFSSDIDVLFLSNAEDGESDHEHQRSLDGFVQTFKKHMEAPSEDGFGYRIDLDLRPKGRQGPLVNPWQTALDYYEFIGADWERQMLIRLREVRAPETQESPFPHHVAPFVYRGSIDPSSISGVRNMKLRIESERDQAGHDLEYELKEGPGGIRDVEFLAQAFQLLFGGRHPELRTGHVLTALRELARLGCLPEQVSDSLGASYLWLRRAEHAVQMVEERQTQRFPRAAEEQLGMARRMGYLDEDADRARSRLLEDWTHIRAEVRSHFDALTLEPPSDAGT
ncbi:MAG: hypothetical protein GY725_07875 [bacterium]|nr:hypothetical protein [bacterium]